MRNIFLVVSVVRSDLWSTRTGTTLCPSKYPNRLLDESPPVVHWRKFKMPQLRRSESSRDLRQGADPGMEPMH